MTSAISVRAVLTQRRRNLPRLRSTGATGTGLLPRPPVTNTSSTLFGPSLDLPTHPTATTFPRALLPTKNILTGRAAYTNQPTDAASMSKRSGVSNGLDKAAKDVAEDLSQPCEYRTRDSTTQLPTDTQQLKASRPTSSKLRTRATSA